MKNQSATALRVGSCAAVFITLLSSCAEAPWFVFKPADGSFQASFPAEPTKVIRTVDSTMGETDVTLLHRNGEAADLHRCGCRLSGRKTSKALERTSSSDQARDVAVEKASGKLQKREAVRPQGPPGP
jgi:hypothetical protein